LHVVPCLQREDELLLWRARESFRHRLVVLVLVYLGDPQVLRGAVAADDLNAHLALAQEANMGD